MNFINYTKYLLIVSYSPNNYDYQFIIEKASKFILNKTLESNSNGIVIGLSGGIDSSVCLALSAKKLSNHNILGLIMPLNGITLNDDERDAIDLANKYGIEYKVILLNNIEDSFKSQIYQEYMNDLEESKIAQGNLIARIRMSILYFHANLSNRIVVGTGDKSELMLGYFTKYGDGGVDISPIADLTKTEVKKIALNLNIIESIIKADPTDGLWENNRTDEDQLGAKYSELEWAMNYRENNMYGKENLSKTQLLL